MPLLPTNQRDQGMVAVGIVAVALSVAYYMYAYTPKAEELATIEAHVESLTTANDRARAEMAKGSVNELRAQAQQMAANLELMRQLVPTGNEVPALLEQVSTAARRTGLDIGAVEPQPVIPGDEFDTYRYKITIVGGYHDLGTFLSNVGSLTRIIAPVNLKLVVATNRNQGSGPRRTRSSASEALLQSDFEMQTYVAKAAAPARVPRGPAKGETKS
ncbi:MAG: type 4a pilus biogenesis protein PilO [Gemmatimonadaceae bacterium]